MIIDVAYSRRVVLFLKSQTGLGFFPEFHCFPGEEEHGLSLPFFFSAEFWRLMKFLISRAPALGKLPQSRLINDRLAPGHFSQ